MQLHRLWAVLLGLLPVASASLQGRARLGTRALKQLDVVSKRNDLHVAPPQVAPEIRLQPWNLPPPPCNRSVSAPVPVPAPALLPAPAPGPAPLPIDPTTAFIEVTTGDSYFVETEEKDAALFATSLLETEEKEAVFATSICKKLGQVVDIPWTRFGVFTKLYNKTDRTALPCTTLSCFPDSHSVSSAKIKCMKVMHDMNTTGILEGGRNVSSFLQWRPKQLTFEVNVQPATFINGDDILAKDVARKLVAAAQDHDGHVEDSTKFHMLFPSTLMAIGTNPFFPPGPLGGPYDNTITIGINPSGHKNGALAEPPKLETAVDVAKEAEAINADTLKRLKDLDSSMQRAAMAHYDALRFTPYTPPESLPSGPLMLAHPDYPPGPDF